MKRNPDFARDAARLEREWGIVLPLSMDYMPEEFKSDFALAMDAQPTLITQPNGGIPAYLTSFMDPEVIRVLQTPNKGAEILGEQKKGSWVDQTAFFPMVENVGEVSSYGDFNTNGRSDVNPNFIQRQSYLFQTHIEYGDLQEERAGVAKLNWVAELQTSAAKTLNKFADYTYHFGVAGLQNYGILNDPALSAALTPSTKANGGTRWVLANGTINAAPTETYNDFLSLFGELQVQAPGYIDEDTPMLMVLPNVSVSGLAATNQFGFEIRKQISDRFKRLTIVTDPRYATASGNVVQLIATELDGSKTGYCAFNEKMRQHRLIAETSSFKQKQTSGTWGAIIRYPLAIAQMIGI